MPRLWLHALPSWSSDDDQRLIRSNNFDLRRTKWRKLYSAILSSTLWRGRPIAQIRPAQGGRRFNVRNAGGSPSSGTAAVARCWKQTLS